MIINKSLGKLFALIFGLFVFAALSNTAQAVQSSFYGGINIGTGDVDFSGYEDSDTLSFYGGSQIGNQMAVEFGYTDLGEFDVSGFPDVSVDVSGFEFSLVGKMATSSSSEFFGRLGMYMWDVEFPFPYGEDSGTSVTFGFGMDINFTPKLGGRIAFQHYGDVSDADITNVSFGIFSSF